MIVKGEVMKGQVKLRMAKARLRRVKSNCEHWALNCKEAGRLLGTSMDSATRSKRLKAKSWLRTAVNMAGSPVSKPVSVYKTHFIRGRWRLRCASAEITSYHLTTPTNERHQQGYQPVRMELLPAIHAYCIIDKHVKFILTHYPTDKSTSPECVYKGSGLSSSHPHVNFRCAIEIP